MLYNIVYRPAKETGNKMDAFKTKPIPYFWTRTRCVDLQSYIKKKQY